MRYPLLLVCEDQGGLAEILRELGREQERRFRVRQPPEACLSLLRRGKPSLLGLSVGGRRDAAPRREQTLLERELKLLERVPWLFPETVAVVVNERDEPALSG